MTIKLVPIGNSRGIRIPKPILEQCGFKDEVELETRSGYLLIRRHQVRRENWDKAFQEMAQKNDDQISEEMKSIENIWDRSEWKW